MIMDARHTIGMANITLINQPSKKRMIRVINEADYQNADTKKLGLIFGIMDVDIGLAQNAQIFDLIQEVISRYYKNPFDCDMAFDDMISFLNHRLIQLIAFKILKEKCDLVIGVIKGEKILFCISGQIYSFVIGRQIIKKIYPEDEKTLDVSNKIFPYSLNGEVLKDHVIYFCNADFNAVIDPYDLGKLLKDASVRDVVSDIKNYLLKKDTAQHYNALFIYGPGHSLNASEGSRISLENLLRREQETEDSLFPSFLNFFRQSLRNKTLANQLMKGFLVIFQKTFSIVKRCISFSAFLVLNLFLVITNIRGQRKERRVIINSQMGNAWFKIMSSYNSLTALSKIILIAVLVLSILLAGSLAYGLNQQKIKQLKLAYKEKMRLADSLHDEADADIIFQDKNSAIKKLKSALAYMQEIPPKIYDTDYENLLKKIKDNLYKIQNISDVSSPVLIADFSAKPDVSLYPPLYLDDNKINLLHQNGILGIDIKNQDIKKSNLATKGLDGAISFYDGSKKIIYLLADNALQAVDPANLTNEIKSFAPYRNESVKFFVVYNEKLYTLSCAEKSFSVWRRNPALSGFGQPILSVTDNLPAAASVSSFAVDSNLYVLFSDNRVHKYYRGARASWSYDAESIADDKIKYKKIITDENHKYIYLLGQKTISILSKEGEFLAHINLPGLNNLQDAAIDESSKTIYILDSSKKIYAFSFSI